ncbi:MAG: hypothetical protein H0X37_18265 [Herpetosiphonaceae bacterium]|nr:hypothetical protein [Herpetosiphonaceae bacterium]
MSFDVDARGSLAILDQVNSRVQIFDVHGHVLHTITVPRTSMHLRLTSKGIAVTEPWKNREVLEYALNGTLLGRTILPSTVEWPTDLYEVNQIIYVEADNQLVAVPFAHRPIPGPDQVTLPGRPLQNVSGMYATFGGFEDGNQSVRMVIRGVGSLQQLKLHLEDRRILQVQDRFFDQIGNTYVQLYVSESLDTATPPERSPEVLLKINPQHEFVRAFLQSSLHYPVMQARQFAVGPSGEVYQLESSPNGVVVYRLELQPRGLGRHIQQPLNDLPHDLVTPPPSRPNVESTRTAYPKETHLTDHSKTPASGATRLVSPLSGSYSGPPPITRDQIIEIAQSAVGSPYVWGGESWNPFNRSYNGADCSGLVSTSWQVYQARPTTQESSSRPSTAELNANSSWWFIDSNSGNRQKGDAFVRNDSLVQHTWLYEQEGGSGYVWSYEALNASYPIRHVQNSMSGFRLTRRYIDGTGIGIAGRDTGWIYSDFQDTFTSFGKEPNVGHPFDNGGTIFVHRWTIPNKESGYAQDFRTAGGSKSVIMHGDGRSGAFWVHGSIYSTYMGMGGPGSFLGWPTTNEVTASNGCSNVPRQYYVGGYITLDCDGVWRAH